MPSHSPEPSNSNGTYKFPVFSPEYNPRDSSEGHKLDDLSLSHDGSPVFDGSRPWMPRRNSARGTKWSGGLNGTASALHGNGRGRHNRQKSLSEALNNIRNRSGSVTQNAKEIADALKAPVSPALVVSIIIHELLLCFEQGANELSGSILNLVLRLRHVKYFLETGLVGFP
jgi:solute carrier family 35 protein E1